tara:strand:- start:213 stop:581 length:369 start_codon:yes stop_codon:yes gene_type:complete
MKSNNKYKENLDYFYKSKQVKDEIIKGIETIIEIGIVSKKATTKSKNVVKEEITKTISKLISEINTLEIHKTWLKQDLRNSTKAYNELKNNYEELDEFTFNNKDSFNYEQEQEYDNLREKHN